MTLPKLAVALCIVAVALVVAGCSSTPVPQQRVSIVTFNVENLFDTTHDPGKNDATYRPVSAKASAAHRQGCAVIKVDAWRRECLELDWSESVVERKLEAVAAAILASSGDGRGPDVLVLQEVENRAIVERLRTQHLRPAGYAPTVLVEGHDRRGIDVAFLSRLPLRGRARLHEVPYPGVTQAVRDDTRGILEATFALPDGTLVTGFAVHFPAPFHPVDLRVQSYARLARLLAQLPAGRLAFAAGDFNTTAAEHWVLERHVQSTWQIAHQSGCDGCRGTYYYARGNEWSFLDMVLLANTAGSRWRLDPRRTAVAAGGPGQTSPGGTPQRFDPRTGQGVSDHWPLRIELLRRAP